MTTATNLWKAALSTIAVVATMAVAVPAALAQGYDSPNRPAYDDPDEPSTPYTEKYGVQVMLGGGPSGFVDNSLEDMTDTAGNYGLRIAYGSKQLFAGEVAYSGTAQDLNAFGVDDDASLVSNGLDASLRVNILPDSAVQPYVMAGIGWRRFEVVSDVNLSTLRDSDDVAEIPTAAGVQFKMDDFIFDTRFTFRSTFDEELNGSDDLHTWNVAASAGYEW